VLIPEENTKDLAEIPDNIKNRLDIHPVKWIDTVLELALERVPDVPSVSEAKDVAPIPPSSEQDSAVMKH
jgi:ATP-dependent Lon protease